VKYRHSFHAGNFADVHKHVTLLALLRSMQRKDKGLLYLDTHAGAGAYDLAGPASHHGAEARGGVRQLAGRTPVAPELSEYLQAVEAWQRHCADRHSYPGSPAIAAQALRPQDRGICCELLPRECRALERTLGGYRRMRIECGDGYRALRAHLPAPERRSLILIDPPYETAAEWDQSERAVGEILDRQANAVVALWYPIKDTRRSVAGGIRARGLSVPATRLELWLYPRDSRVGLNGSGMLIVHPPYRFEERAAEWQRELWSLLDSEQRGGQSVLGLAPSSSSVAGAGDAHAGA
jgi:23S rRNA (adenine2030-N6)-methyltransferase